MAAGTGTTMRAGAAALIMMRDGRELSAGQVRADPLARAAQRTVRQFDAFLARHDAPTAARVPEGFRVDIAPGVDGASASDNLIELGGPNRLFRSSTAHSPEIIGHELTHGIDQRMTMELRMVDEGWGDMIGAAFAREIGRRPQEHWRLADGMIRAPAGAPTHLRDLLDPAIRTTAGLRRRVALAERAPGQAWLLLSGHDFAGLITRPGALAAAEIGAAKVGSIYTHALLHELPAAMPAAMRDAFAGGERAQRAGGAWPLADIYIAAIRTSAQATLDAARTMPGAGRSTDALRAGWKRIGISGLD